MISKPGHQKNRDQPVAVEKSSRCEGLRTGLGGNPTGNQVSQAKHLRRVGLHEILVPEQAGKWRCKRSPRHVIENENFLLPEADESPLGNFSKKNDRHPTGRRPDSGSDHQAQIHRARHHQKPDEECPNDRFPPEALFEFLRGLEQIAVFLEFFVFVHVSAKTG